MAGASNGLFKWLPVVDEANCTGCALCIEACGPQSLELVRNLVTLSRPESCGSEEHCIAPCEYDAIRMEWVAMDGDRSVGVWREGACA